MRKFANQTQRELSVSSNQKVCSEFIERFFCIENLKILFAQKYYGISISLDSLAELEDFKQNLINCNCQTLVFYFIRPLSHVDNLGRRNYREREASESLVQSAQWIQGKASCFVACVTATCGYRQQGSSGRRAGAVKNPHSRWDAVPLNSAIINLFWK